MKKAFLQIEERSIVRGETFYTNHIVRMTEIAHIEWIKAKNTNTVTLYFRDQKKPLIIHNTMNAEMWSALIKDIGG